LRILLISANTAVTPYIVYPIGCSMIAASLSDAKHEVFQFDFLQQDSSLDALSQAIADFDPELIGISIRNIDNVNSLNEQSYVEAVKDIVSRVRRDLKTVVVLGGAGFSLLPEHFLRETSADYGIVGEGESLMLNFVNNAASGVYPKERLIGPETKLKGSGIPSARYDKHLIEYYLRKTGIAPLQTKRGCSQKCVYCSYPALEGSRIRQRDVRLVVDDIEMLCNTYKVKYIFFVDSVFNDDEGAYLNLVEEMKRRKTVVPWMAFFKPEGLDDRIIELMKETGLVSVQLGSDAATDSTLRELGKRFCFNDIVKSNDLFVKHGISPSHYFMFGGPGETEKTVFEGIENIKSLKNCTVFPFAGIRILPDTLLYDICVDNGILKNKNLLEPTYYISPAVEKEWLYETLSEAFSEIRWCVFPPDSFDDTAKILYELGCAGPLWDKMT